jgi:hypothetical protein
VSENRNTEQKIKQIERDIIKFSILDTPGVVLLALGLYGKYAEGEAFWSALNDATTATVFIIIGGLIMAACAARIVILAKQKADLLQQPNAR